MSNPDVCKKLKESGFPQFLYLGANYWRDGISSEVVVDLSSPYEPKKNILDPSLEDLIYRCAEKEKKNPIDEVNKIKREWIDKYIGLTSH